MAVFRVEKSNDYSVMPMQHLLDKTLSLGAKGLMSVLLSLPNDRDRAAEDIENMLGAEDEDIYALISELASHGYIERVHLPNGKRSECVIN